MYWTHLHPTLHTKALRGTHSDKWLANIVCIGKCACTWKSKRNGRFICAYAWSANTMANKVFYISVIYSGFVLFNTKRKHKYTIRYHIDNNKNILNLQELVLSEITTKNVCNRRKNTHIYVVRFSGIDTWWWEGFGWLQVVFEVQ